MDKRLCSLDYIIISLLSCGIVCFIYHFLYDKIGYTNLNDFFVGESIYKNHNKLLDLATFPLYIATFFIIIPIYKLFPKLRFKIELPDINFKIKPFIQDNKCLFMTLQTILSFGYLILYPFNRKFYPVLAGFIIFLIIFSIINSYVNLYKKEQPELSIFAFMPVFIALFGNGYNFSNITVDIHHEGEKLAVWLMHSHYNMAFYKDVMLVHGFCDVIPPILSEKIFRENTLNSFYLGRSLFDNIILMLTVGLSYYIFKKAPILISFSMFSAFNIPQLYILSFLVFIKSKKNILWLLSYILFAFAGLFFWTTYGTFWLLASLPLAIYVFYKQPKKYVSIILIGLIMFLSKDFLYNYITSAIDYIQCNLIAFGNNFPPLKLHQIPSDLIKLFAFLATPFFIIKLVEEYKNKNLSNVFVLLFAILFVCVSINYSLGRIDGILMLRIRDISLSYLALIIPFLFINNKNIKYAAAIFAILLVTTSIPNLTKWKTISLAEQNTTEIKKILNKYSKAENDFLDLNSGINYFIFNKQMPIPYTSYFNIVSSKQNKKIANIEPNIILLETNIPRFDNVYPSLRINPFYKKMLLNPDYSTIKTENNLFLIKEKGKKDLKDLDNALSTNNLSYLPDAWYNSKNKLKIKEIKIQHKLNDNNIIFEKQINGSDIDLIELNTENKNLKYEISINNSSSKLKFNSKQNEVLFPFDNFPSWFLNKKVNIITIKTNRPTKIISVKFYQKD